MLNDAVNDNNNDGIHILSGRKIFVKTNIVLSNGDDGIDVEKAARGRANHNRMRRSNRDYAIEAHSRVHGTHNVGAPCKPANLCE